MTFLFFVVGTIGFIILFGIIIYNRFVRLRFTVRSSWSDIDVLLKKRYNLVPNLVETVKGYASHERAVFEKVTEARAKAMQASSPAEKAQAENIFRETLKSLFAVAEAYPDLKASVQFSQLQTQLQQVEDSIEYARRYYNAVVRDYNTMTEAFPSNLIAGQFGFTKEEFFELEAPVEREPVQVKF
ncbi:MAG: LemA family protein [Nitrospirae bacterium]|nr:LemA family protein [Nitrospirota bacterium]